MRQGGSVVQIVENWANIKGTAEEVARDGDDLTIELRLESADDVAGYPNLLASELGSRITLRVPQARETVEPGDVIRCRARRAGPDRFFGLGDTLARSA
ncbi:MAG TPA: hypothetical protein VF021_04290 [Longimicrobiales bacterium]